jgi:isopentenyl diphosphate isomerase/L-lactate dehydrogenase-like FMN-dependent dehydrogenase
MNPFVQLVVDQVGADVRRWRAARVDGAVGVADVGVPRRLRRAHSVADLRVMARRALPKTIFDFVDGGAQDELAMARNRAALDAISIVGRVLTDVSSVDLSTTVVGERIGVPMIGAPTGVVGLVHSAGEPALARAYDSVGSIYTLATSASYSIEDVAAASSGSKWFQLYVWRDRDFVVEILDRAQRAGFRALVVTVDGSRTGRRERDLRNGFSRPLRVSTRALASGVAHPRWSVDFVRHGRFVPVNFKASSGGPAAHAESFAAAFDPGLTWREIEWIRSSWSGPLVVKGILHPLDAKLAVAAGAEAVVVSNHGGRQLDDAPATIDLLPGVVAAVGDQAEVLFDSGIRRGSDVVNALALGARACLIGRPTLYGLAAGGEAGARHALQLLRTELEITLALTGCRTIDETRELDLRYS